MKKFSKVLIATLLLFSVVGASERSDQEAATAREFREKFCNKNENVTGCIYDPSRTVYINAIASEFGSKDDNILESGEVAKLERAYQAADKDGQIVFAGCYRASGGFLFKVIEPDGSSCHNNKNHNDSVPFGESSSAGATDISFSNWTSDRNGECPKIFAYTANTRWCTSHKHRFMFTNDAADLTDAITMSIFTFSGDTYTRVPACTSLDVTGLEELKACYQDALDDINAYTCPTDLKQMANISSDLEKYKDACQTKYDELYSKGLLDENATLMQTNINNAIRNKTASCQQNKCGLSTTKVNSINTNTKGTQCENGCSITSTSTPSSDPNAQCYCCGSSGGCAYKYEVTKPANNCSLMKDKPKNMCIGTTNDDKCRNCLSTAYKNAGLTQAEISCMTGSDMDVSVVNGNVGSEIKDQFEEQTAETIAESQELVENIALSQDTGLLLNANMEKPDLEIDTSPKTCSEILGKNLTKIVKFAIVLLRVAGAVIAIVNSMIALVPAVMSKDADALQKAKGKCISMGILLAVILVFPSILRFIGNVLGFDISCIV